MLKKFLMMMIVCSAFVLSAISPSDAADLKKVANLGEDKDKMAWYIMDYGRDSKGLPFAVARKYYTNNKIRQQIINSLISRYKVDEEKAKELYFTAYRYEFTEDGKQFKEVYERHYGRSGEQIFLGFNPKTRDNQNRKGFRPLEDAKNSMMYKIAKYALGK